MVRAKKVRGDGGEPDSGHNGAMLAAFRKKVLRLWCRTLRRRSNQHPVTWARMYRLADRWLPNPGFSIPPLRNAWASLPEDEAQCVGSARRDLGRGCRVTGFPSATDSTHVLQ
jgi:hypothetical protein